MNRDVQPLVFSVTEAACALGVGENEIRALVRIGQLDGFHTRGGGRLLVSRDACLRYIERQESEARMTRGVSLMRGSA